MKRFLSALLLLALLVSVLACPALAAADASANTPTHLRTSFCPDDYLDLTISGRRLHIEGVITLPGLHQISAKAGSSHEYIDAQSGRKFTMNLLLDESPCTLSVYTFLDGAGSGWGYCYGRIVMEEDSGEYRFAKSLVEDANAQMLNVWVDPKSCLDQTVSVKIKTLSDQIVGGETDDYRKLYLIHAWLAENIYYDYDFYYGYSDTTTYSAEEIADSRRSVCEGYANLALALIRAQSIPCIKVTTFALGVSTSGGSFAISDPGEKTLNSNHAHVEAFVDDRWIIMDPTWDSSNDYRDGEYQYQAPNGYYYFDITPEVFALDHKIMSRGGAYLDADNTVVSIAALSFPSSWAAEEVYAAQKAGLVPYALKSRYQSGITRAETAKLLNNLIEAASGRPIDALLSQKGLSISVSPFTDTSDEAVLACNALGIIKGVGSGCFSPDTILTREQIAAMLCRAARVLGVKTDDYSHSFVDVSGRWCSAELGWPSASGIIRGVGGSRFDPDGRLTREQAIAMIYRAFTVLAA